MNPEELSILFTSYNSIYYLKLAIQSFLDLYPEFKNSLTVFDDYSSDGTKEWLEKTGIQKISWTRYPHVSNVNSYRKIYQLIRDPVNLSLRNSFMLNDAMSQLTTKYVMINDSDILFLKKGFMERYQTLFSEGTKIIAPSELVNYGWKFSSVMPKESIHNYLGKYILLYRKEKGSMFRFHFCHTVLDLEFFKSEGLLFDDVSDTLFCRRVVDKTVLETGSGLTYEILERNIPYTDIKNKVHNSNQPLNDECFDNYDIYHFRWKASAVRAKELYSTNTSDLYQDKETEDLQSSSKLREIVRRFSMEDNP